MQAEIALKYDDPQTAKAVIKAILPDNLITPRSLSVKTSLKDTEILTKITCKKLSTLIATIDDLLSCVSTAEKTIRLTKGLNEKP